MVPHVSVLPEPGPARDTLAAAVLGLRLRMRGVEHFLGVARHSPTRATLSALHYHARSLRLRAERAHADTRGIADNGRPSL